MRNIFFAFILGTGVFPSYAQLNTTSNLQFVCNYQTPHNCYDLYWTAPVPSVTDTLVGYNIYRNNTFYAFTTTTGIQCNPCIGDTDHTYCSFMYNPAYFYAHVKAVYNAAHIESGYTDSIYNPGCGLIISVEEHDHLNELNITPNPFASQTTLQSSLSWQNATLTLYNAWGEKVKQLKNVSGIKLTLTRDNLPAGLYFIQLSQEGNTFTKSIMISDN